MKYKILTIVITLAVGLTTAYAGNPDRTGAAGAQELLIPVGARGAALGEAGVANASGADAIYWNPAGLADLHEGTEALFSHQPYLADIDVECAAIATAVENFGTIGFSVKVVDIGEMEETTTLLPEGTGRVFTPTYTVVGLSWAKPFTTNINFGVTGSFIRETIFEVSATGVAFDFGFTYDTKFRGLTLGFVMKNYGPDMRFTGKGFDRIYEAIGKRPLSSDNATFELPTSINIALAYNFLNNGANSATVVGNFKANNQADDRWQGGVEYSYDERFFLRGGYNYSEQEGYIYGASFGGGVAVPVASSTLSLEYTWTETDVFDSNQFFTVKFAF